MQTQQQKSVVRQRLSVGEIVVAALNLILAAVAGSFAYTFLFLYTGSLNSLFTGISGALVAVGSLATSLLVLLRQRRVAVYAQWLASLGIVFFGAVMAWLTSKNRTLPPNLNDLILFGSVFGAALVLAWFAWLLKRMDESE
jgi:drug/metabolite transporter (DMT)-like permease